MANPFACFDEDRPISIAQVTPKKIVKLKQNVDHTEAQRIFQEYMMKAAYLKKQQAYAEQVAVATHGGGQTLVEPLATMGTNGGPLLCDHCHKPMILEGGRFNKIYADKAWIKNPQKGCKSYISGGMVVRIVGNGTLRIYHGHPDVSGECDYLAEQKLKDQERMFIRDEKKFKMILEFLKDQWPENINDYLGGIVRLMIDFDPGFGINRS